MNMRYQHLFQSSLIRNLRRKMVVGRHLATLLTRARPRFSAQYYHAEHVNFVALKDYERT